MSISNTLASRKLLLVLNKAADADGSATTSTKYFNYVNQNATAAQMYAAADALAALMSDSLDGIYYTDKNKLLEVDEEGEG